MTRNISYKEPDVYKVPLSIVIILAILYGSISMLAVVGNGLVIYVVFKDKRMQTVTNVLIVNLALSDILLGMFTTPFQFQPALHQRWDFPEFMCVIAPPFKVLSVIISVLTLTFISLDRYVAVMYPLKAGFSKPNAVLSLILIWLFGVASSFPEGYFDSVEQIYDPEIRKFKPFCLPKWPSEGFGKYYYWYLLCVQYLFPLVIINVAYTRISCRIRGTKAPGVTVDRENERQRTRRKVVKMLIIVVLLFVICWMPLQLYNVISEFKPEINKYKYIRVIWFCSNWLAMSNYCYNPFIYSLLNERFKREFRALFSKARCTRPSGTSRLNGNDLTDDSSGTKRIILTYRPPNSNGQVGRSWQTRMNRYSVSSIPTQRQQRDRMLVILHFETTHLILRLFFVLDKRYLLCEHM